MPVLAVVNTAVRVAVTRWAAGDAMPLTEHVREAFGMLAAGLDLPLTRNNA